MHEAKSRKNRKFYFKEDFSRETFEIEKSLWNEVFRLREEEGKFPVICDMNGFIHKVHTNKIRIACSIHAIKNYHSP